ncbi:MAG: hypothetical protein HGA36_03720, partial [Candidatus Moranbacteria bacterium]|nr:hypothetical protein [Candidatus Moranbacteria bacterium]
GNITGNAATVTDGVYATTDQTISGIKTFTNGIVSNVTGNVTGDVTGDLTGNVVGDVTGNLTGDVVGNVTGDVTGDVVGNLFGNATTATTADTVLNGAITNAKLAANAVTTDKIADGTIVGADLASDIDVATTGDISAGTLSDGTATIAGGNLSSSANSLSLNVGNNASSSDVFIRNTGAGVANLNVEGNVTGQGTLGTSGSRWSTIYADAINFLTGLTNESNNGTPSFIKLGTSGGDASQIQIGNSSASVDVQSGNWGIGTNGVARFSGLNLNGNINFDTSRAINLSSASNTVLSVINSGAGVADLNVERNGIFGGALTSGSRFTVTTGGFDITGTSDMRGNLDMHNNVIQNIGNAGTDFTTSGGLTLDGQLTANGGIDMSDNDITGVNNIAMDGSLDLSAAKIKIPNGTVLPLVCAKGEMFIKTDGQIVTVGGNIATAYLFVCIGSNNWKPGIN